MVAGGAPTHLRRGPALAVRAYDRRFIREHGAGIADTAEVLPAAIPVSASADHHGCIAMMVASAVAPLPPIYYLYGIRVPGLIWLFRLDNIQRLLAGQERRIGRSGQATSGSR